MKHKDLFVRFPEGKAKVLTFSYDDSVIFDQRLVEILDQHGMKGTFNLNTGCFRPEGTTGRMMIEAETKALFANGRHEVAIHTLTHPFLDTLPPVLVMQEFLEDRKNLERMFGIPVRGMAYPFGTSGATEQVMSVAKNCGIVYGRTTVSTHDFDLPDNWLRMPSTCHHNDVRLMELAEQFVNARTDSRAKLFYLWGHAYEFNDYNNWEIIERFTAYIDQWRDSVWYATNIEVYDYLQAYDRLVFSVEMESVYNPSATPVWFFLNGTVYKVAPGETLKI